jgi:sRNA-binding carbon storage regulator CsrA
MLLLSRRVNDYIITDHGLYQVAGVTRDHVDLLVLADARRLLSASGDGSVVVERECDGLRRYRVRLTKDAKLTVDDDKWIAFVMIGGPGTARLGFELPKEGVIHRLEVYEAIVKGSPGGGAETGGSGLDEIRRVYTNRRLLDDAPAA